MIYLLFTAFVTGVAGSAHCLGMCGGITIHLGIHSNKKRFLLIYHIGRIFSYSLLGFIASLLLNLFGFNWQNISGKYIRLFIALMMFLIGIQICFNFNLLQKIEGKALKLMRPILDFAQNFLPVRNNQEALIVGVLWGFLPCGLIYSAVLLAISSANPFIAFSTMFAFGLGTLPALLIVNLFSGIIKALIGQSSRMILGLLIVINAYLTAKPFL